MAITTSVNIRDALLASPQNTLQKVIAAPKGAGAFQSGWLGTGLPAAGAASPAYTAGSGYTCDITKAGAMRLLNAGNQLYVGKFSVTLSGTFGTLILADRLWSCSGMGFAIGTYSVTTPGNLPTRIVDNGVGVEAYVEQFVTGGAASGTLTLNYLNAATGAAKAGVIGAVVSAPATGQMQPIPWQVGDTGIRQVTSAANSATWTSGTYGITLLKRVAEFPIPAANIPFTFDWAQCGLGQIPNDACLMWYFLGAAATATTVTGNILLLDK